MGSRHVRAGFWAIAIFAATGLALEALHAWKVPWYVDPAAETRRLLFRLGHAHGTLLGLVNVAFGLALRAHVTLGPRAGGLASGALLSSLVLVPLGFFLGGLGAKGGDPGAAVLVTPVGGVLFVIGAALAGWGARARSEEGSAPGGEA